jgi:hypothetical protein
MQVSIFFTCHRHLIDHGSAALTRLDNESDSAVTPVVKSSMKAAPDDLRKDIDVRK